MLSSVCYFNFSPVIDKTADLLRSITDVIFTTYFSFWQYSCG